MLVLIASQERGMIARDDGITQADLDRLRWLIPADDDNDASRFSAHINDDGRPRCGAALPYPYLASKWRAGWYPCPACEDADDTPQMALFGEATG